MTNDRSRLNAAVGREAGAENENDEMKVLLLNAGSSSLKLTLVEATGGGVVIARGQADWAGETTRNAFTGPNE